MNEKLNKAEAADLSNPETPGSIADRRRNASFRVGFAEDNSKGIAEEMEDINETSVGDEAPGTPAVEAAEAPARQREACNTELKTTALNAAPRTEDFWLFQPESYRCTDPERQCVSQQSAQ